MKNTNIVRCAIYTRKSTEEGLNMEFNSLDAQRESGENYIATGKEVRYAKDLSDSEKSHLRRHYPPRRT